MDNKRNGTIVYKRVSGINTVGYGVEFKSDNDSSDNCENIPIIVEMDKAKIIGQIEEGLIAGAEVVVDGAGVKHIVLNSSVYDNIEILDAVAEDSIKLVGRIVGSESGETVGFIVKNEDGKRVKVDAGKIWELILGGRVEGVKASIVNGCKCISDDGSEYLKNLPNLSEQWAET